ncbi:DNA-directed RNA polymerase IV and V subunit 2 [Vigna angularis]|uniref:DNA-directed RNA polymerase n=2 Tax=Phaseolus angularis TaxID=3914 RepID=A0A8T0KMR1_PHAAN|nr:DNA-directed RNA polymerase IV and V subunit 2 [Vigna angularis]
MRRYIPDERLVPPVRRRRSTELGLLPPASWGPKACYKHWRRWVWVELKSLGPFHKHKKSQVPWGFGVFDDGAPIDPDGGHGDLAHPPAVVVKDIDLLAGREGGSDYETRGSGSEYRRSRSCDSLRRYASLTWPPLATSLATVSVRSCDADGNTRQRHSHISINSQTQYIRQESKRNMVPNNFLEYNISEKGECAEEINDLQAEFEIELQLYLDGQAEFEDPEREGVKVTVKDCSSKSSRSSSFGETTMKPMGASYDPDQKTLDSLTSNTNHHSVTGYCSTKSQPQERGNHLRHGAHNSESECRKPRNPSFILVPGNALIGMGHIGSSKDGTKAGMATAMMDIDGDSGDDDLDPTNAEILEEFGGEDAFRYHCKKFSMLFFEEYGLISHQINSYNHYVNVGLQRTFDGFGDLVVTPGFDPSKKGDNEHYRYASIKFGKVKLDKPMVWGGELNNQELKMLPRHARLQRMTYASKMKILVKVQVYVPKKIRSDKFKTGKEEFLDKEILTEDESEIIIGKLPVMVKSDLCWMKGEKDDCEFDHGGYFLIKGAEKTFIAQEQLYLKRFWVINSPGWMIAYKSQMKRNRMVIKLVGNSRNEGGENGDMFLTVYFLSVEVPVWVLFFALGVGSDKDVVDLIGCDNDDVRIQNILLASDCDADKKCGAFRSGRNAVQYLEKCMKGVQFPPPESIEECLEIYVFPGISGLNRKARFLAYMVKGLLLAGRRKCDNRDDFRNKRLELANELLERELKVHIAHVRKRMSKALQRDLYGDRDHGHIRTRGWKGSLVWLQLLGTNPLQTMAELRRASQQVQYMGKVGDARYPHPSHWGKVCFLSTPDGENCGLVKNMAVTGLVSTDVSNASESILPTLLDCGKQRQSLPKR